MIPFVWKRRQPKLISSDINQINISLGQGAGRGDRRKRLTEKKERLRELSEKTEMFCICIGAVISNCTLAGRNFIVCRWYLNEVYFFF